MAQAAPSLLSVNELLLVYGTQRLLDGATLAVAAGEKVGLVGRNGCGKTSLLKILTQEQPADAGEISRRRGLRVGYLPQEFELDDAKTVQENIEAGGADVQEWIRKYEEGEGTEAELADILHHIELADGWNLDTRAKAYATALDAPALDKLVGPLSGGEKRRVALCRALVSMPDLLLLDEPTNHLDAESIRWLEDFLRNFAGAVIFVTHDRYFLDVIATRIIELSEGKCYSHPGNYTAYLESKAARQSVVEQSERRRQRFIKAELEYVRAGVRAQRSKSRGRLDKFYEIAGQAAPPEEKEMDLLIPPPPKMGDIGVELVDVGACVGEGDSGQPGSKPKRWLFTDLNLSLRAGQCTGIVGRNGVGKTTLLKICMGERGADAGVATVGKKVVFNYIDQVRMSLKGTGTVMEEVEDTDGVVRFGEQTISVRGYLRRFLFADARVNERVDKLSGGERARLMLAKVLKRGGNILVLDEPTNDLDLASLRMLEEALARFDGAVLVVSHDRFFLDRICDQVVAFEDDNVVVQPGNYSYYLEKRAARQLREKAAPVPKGIGPISPIGPMTPAPKPKKLSFKDQRELDSMESTIAVAEKKEADLQATLDDPQFYITRSQEAASLMSELEAYQAEIAHLYERWEELTAQAAAPV